MVATDCKMVMYHLSECEFISVSEWFFSSKLALGVPLHVLSKQKVLGMFKVCKD